MRLCIKSLKPRCVLGAMDDAVRATDGRHLLASSAEGDTCSWMLCSAASIAMAMSAPCEPAWHVTDRSSMHCRPGLLTTGDTHADCGSTLWRSVGSAGVAVFAPLVDGGAWRMAHCTASRRLAELLDGM